MHVLMIAAENDAIPGAKVGGVADVVRDLPKALPQHDVSVDVVIPDYGQYATKFESRQLASVNVEFAGQTETVTLFELFFPETPNKVRQFVVQHPLFGQGGHVYSHDEGNRPFATDATKYALFNLAVCQLLIESKLTRPDVLHLHDWHSATIAVLNQYAPQYTELANIHSVYTVHNIALQGIRPIADDESSLRHWFPTLNFDQSVVADPRYTHCYNPMRAGINLCNKVHVVSPTYAEEVLHASDANNGFFGGEGLEKDLAAAKQQGRLVGILNGCEYAATPTSKRNKVNIKPALSTFLAPAQQQVKRWLAQSAQLKTVHYLANEQINNWHSQAPFTDFLVTSIGRLTDQKALLLRQPYRGKTVLSVLLDDLARVNGRLIILGSGDTRIEFEFMQLMASHDNFLFLNGYGQALSDQMYLHGDLFLMPSSFEPCGISQMLAMRDGQPCLVHAVGGLKDTVQHLENGFSFNGSSLQEQSDNLITAFNDAIKLHANNPKTWKKIADNAKSARFSWQESTKQYLDLLYTPA
ncbi:MAG: glycogen synthase [Moritella sp.]|uniref:glycogen synthase n=1 Tax=Moritella sp. TaxID=78556 RepID=UPI001D66416D|nr:glycogen/starch synthase [Moritella sp.]NQZ38541.1 glycogen synthase [Moritella sp.]